MDDKDSFIQPVLGLFCGRQKVIGSDQGHGGGVTCGGENVTTTFDMLSMIVEYGSCSALTKIIIRPVSPPPGIPYVAVYAFFHLLPLVVTLFTKTRKYSQVP